MRAISANAGTRKVHAADPHDTWRHGTTLSLSPRRRPGPNFGQPGNQKDLGPGCRWRPHSGRRGDSLDVSLKAIICGDHVSRSVLTTIKGSAKALRPKKTQIALRHRRHRGQPIHVVIERLTHRFARIAQ